MDAGEFESINKTVSQLCATTYMMPKDTTLGAGADAFFGVAFSGVAASDCVFADAAAFLI